MPLYVNNFDIIKKDKTKQNVLVEDKETKKNLSDTKTQLNNRIDNLITELNYPDEIILIGDSYGTNNGGGVTLNNTYPNIVKSYLGMSDETFHYKYENGAGFNNGRFLANLKTIKATRNNCVKEVYFFGGWNDISERSSDEIFYNGVQACADYVKTTYPNAKMYCGIIAGAYSATNPYTRISTAYTRYSGLGNYGISYIPNTEFICHTYNPSFWAGTSGEAAAHPGNNGIIDIANYVVTAIRSKSVDVIRQETGSLYFGTNDTSHQFSVAIYMINNLITMTPVNIDAVFNPVINLGIQSGTYSKTDFVKVGGINSNLLHGELSYCGFNANGVVFVDRDTQNGEFEFKLINGDLYARFNPYSYTGTTFTPQMTQFTLKLSHYTFSTMNA